MGLQGFTSQTFKQINLKNNINKTLFYTINGDNTKKN